MAVATRFKGRVSLVQWNSGHITSSFKSVRWREKQDRVQAETVANTVVPVGWFQGHREADVEWRLLGEITATLSGTQAYSAGGDNATLTSCSVEFPNHLGSTMYVLFVSPIIDSIETPLEDATPTEFTVRMKCYYVTLPALK